MLHLPVFLQGKCDLSRMVSLLSKEQASEKKTPAGSVPTPLPVEGDAAGTEGENTTEGSEQMEEGKDED